MGFSTVIDLSHSLRPGQEARPLEIKQLESTHITGAPDEEAWYVMHHVHLVNHMGTHIEVPYHCLEDGADLGQIHAEQYVGEAIILDLRLCSERGDPSGRCAACRWRGRRREPGRHRLLHDWLVSALRRQAV